jgi:hypothetical protein
MDAFDNGGVVQVDVTQLGRQDQLAYPSEDNGEEMF